MSRVLVRARHRNEQGAVAILVAIAMLALVLSAAMVLDFGLARYQKVTNKSVADASVAAGAQSLDEGVSDYHPWKAVCAAVAYLKANDPRLTSLTESYKTGGGSGVGGACAGTGIPQDTPCSANNPASWAWYTATTSDGRITVNIKSGYVMPDPGFPDDSTLSADNGTSAAGGCDQIAVIIRQSQKPGFGSLATSSDLISEVRSVGRSTPDFGTEGTPPALLMLERHSCAALQSGSQNTNFDVLGSGTSPGSIHVDSLGDGSLCNGGGKVLYGKFPSPPGIRAQSAPIGGLAGMITTAALSTIPGATPANATDGTANVCAQQANSTCGPAIARGFIGRGPVDRRYLTGVRNAMTTAQTNYSYTTTQAAAAGYTVWTPSSCNNLQTTDLPASVVTAANVFVNCPSGAGFKTVQFGAATTNVVFNSSVSISSSNTLSIPSAQRVYIKGNGGSGLTGGGSLNLNLGTSSTCASRTTAGRNQLVIGNGAFSATGTFHMCNTTVLMADGFQGTSCPVPTVATPITTEPSDNTCGGYISLGANGSMDWTAPNLVTGQSTSADWVQLEDLALWTETSGVNSSTQSTLGGGGVMNVSGVFFLPNANPFNLSGGGLQSNGANAQFIARRLLSNGQGTLYLKPSPQDAVTIPLDPIIGLVR